MSDLPAVIKPTFHQMLAQLHSYDDALADPDFDPEQLVGDLRDKVDGLNAILIRMEVTAAYLRDFSAPIVRKAQTLEKNWARLREYIVFAMESQNVEVFPGNAFKVELQAAGTPALKIRAAEPRDVTDWPQLANLQSSYSWDNAAVKAALDADLLPDSFPGRLERSRFPVFKPNIPQSLEKKKKVKK